MKHDKPLESIKSSSWSRRLSLAKLTASAGARAAAHAVGGLWRGDEAQGVLGQELIVKQIAMLTAELGQLKGSIMKAGQMLAMYGEHFLPPEAMVVLRSLQSDSPPVQFRVVREVLERELPAELLADLDIDAEPIGAASLGQVHRAHRRSDGAQLALKIQYPGVAESIDSDLATMRRLFAMTKLMPDSRGYDAVYTEVKQMLHQEMDYCAERDNTLFFHDALSADGRYVVPRIIAPLCAPHVLCTTYEAGMALPNATVLGWSDERRARLGAAALDLYLRELFTLQRVQTDPHFGNYRVRTEGDVDKLVLFDFGAVRAVPDVYIHSYKTMMRGVFAQDLSLLSRGAEGLGFLRYDDSDERRAFFMRICTLVVEPFSTPDMPGVRRDLFDANNAYDWGNSDLPKRVIALMPEAQRILGFRPPPAASVFLDRKLGGMFVFLSTLRVRLDGRSILMPYLESQA